VRRRRGRRPPFGHGEEPGPLVGVRGHQLTQHAQRVARWAEIQRDPRKRASCPKPTSTCRPRASRRAPARGRTSTPSDRGSPAAVARTKGSFTSRGPSIELKLSSTQGLKWKRSAREAGIRRERLQEGVDASALGSAAVAEGEPTQPFRRRLRRAAPRGASVGSNGRRPTAEGPEELRGDLLCAPAQPARRRELLLQRRPQRSRTRHGWRVGDLAPRPRRGQRAESQVLVGGALDVGGELGERRILGERPLRMSWAGGRQFLARHDFEARRNRRCRPRRPRRGHARRRGRSRVTRGSTIAPTGHRDGRQNNPRGNSSMGHDLRNAGDPTRCDFSGVLLRRGRDSNPRSGFIPTPA
jgi:hypothetical protein